MLTYLMVNLSVVLLSATVGAFNNEYESSHRDPDVRERFGGEWHVARFVELRGRTRYRERVDSMAGRARLVINDSLIAFRFANPLVSIDERCNLDSVSLREIGEVIWSRNPGHRILGVITGREYGQEARTVPAEVP